MGYTVNLKWRYICCDSLWKTEILNRFTSSSGVTPWDLWQELLMVPSQRLFVASSESWMNSWVGGQLLSLVSINQNLRLFPLDWQIFVKKCWCQIWCFVLCLSSETHVLFERIMRFYLFAVEIYLRTMNQYQWLQPVNVFSWSFSPCLKFGLEAPIFGSLTACGFLAGSLLAQLLGW